MTPLEQQLIIGACIALPIVIGLTWAISSVVMVINGDAAWEARKKSHKYRNILK